MEIYSGNFGFLFETLPFLGIGEEARWSGVCDAFID